MAKTKQPKKEKSGKLKMSAKIGGKEIDLSKILEGSFFFNKGVRITSGDLVDGYCHYGYQILSGEGKGDEVPKRKGAGWVMNDLTAAMRNLSVHLAFLDGVFRHAGIATDNLAELRANELCSDYEVDGFKVTGTWDSESIVLHGNKYSVEARDRIALTMPKQSITDESKYKFWSEFEHDINRVRTEIEHYMNGKYVHEEEAPTNQIAITDVDFEKAEVE